MVLGNLGANGMSAETPIANLGNALPPFGVWLFVVCALVFVIIGLVVYMDRRGFWALPKTGISNRTPKDNDEIR